MKPLLAFTTMLAPALVQACPSCARDTGPFTALLIAGIIGAPYAIGYLAVRAIRQVDRPAGTGVEP